MFQRITFIKLYRLLVRIRLKKGSFAIIFHKIPTSYEGSFAILWVATF